MVHAANRPSQTKLTPESAARFIVPDRQHVLRALAQATGDIPPVSRTAATEALQRGRDQASCLLASAAVHGVMIAQGNMDPDSNLSAFVRVMNARDQRNALKHQKVAQTARNGIAKRLDAEEGRYGVAATEFATLVDTVTGFQTDFEVAYIRINGRPDGDALTTLYDQTDSIGSPVLDMLPSGNLPAYRNSSAGESLVEADRLVRYILLTAKTTISA